MVHCFNLIVDTGQHGFLSYCADLGLTAGVVCRTVRSQVSYSLRLMEFCEWEDGTWGMIWHEIGTAGVGIPK